MRLFLPVLFLGLISFPALAHDHEHPENNEWYKSLKSKSGSPCCDGSDAMSVMDPDWETQNKENSHFRVRLDVSTRVDVHDWQWVDVPDSAIVDEPNRAGVAKVWPYTYSPSGGPTRTVIRCFLPGEMG